MCFINVGKGSKLTSFLVLEGSSDCKHHFMRVKSAGGVSNKFLQFQAALSPMNLNLSNVAKEEKMLMKTFEGRDSSLVSTHQ